MKTADIPQSYYDKRYDAFKEHSIVRYNCQVLRTME